MVRRSWRALLGSWEILVEACPELGTPATPGGPCIIGRPGTGFRWANGVGTAMIFDFGAEPSRPASLLCTLRTHSKRAHSECCHSSGDWSRLLLFQTLPSAIARSSPPDAGRCIVASRFQCRSCECGYIVRGLRTVCCLAAPTS